VAKAPIFAKKPNFMKQFLFASLFATVFALTVQAQISTPSPSPLSKISQSVGLTNVSIEYSRPAVRGRKIFGNLVPFDKVWRTGANQITTIKFDHEVMVNGQKLAAGKYGLYTIPGKTQWTIIFNTDSEQWGSYAYDQAKDVLRLTVKPEKLLSNVENMSIAMESINPTSLNLILSWELTAVRFKVEHNAHDQIMAQIKEKTSKADCSTDDFFTAADYYYENNLDLPQALAWADKVVEKDKQYWTYQLRARIYSKMGKCDKAVGDARTSLEMAKKEGDDAYVLKNKAILDKCGVKP
jgi:Protein of unknown function (DUF2911)